MTNISNEINNQIGGSLSGVTNQLLIQNDSNTASSAALEILRVGGGSAGDPFHNYQVTGGSQYSVGVDNSDSDSYVIAASSTLGTTNTVRIASTGEINYPLQSAFLSVDGAVNNVTGDGNFYLYGNNAALTEIYDQNSDFSVNGIYTAPVSGIFQCGGSIALAQIGAAHHFLFVQLAGASFLYTALDAHAFNYANASGIASAPFSFNVHLDAGDTCNLLVTVDGGTKVVDIGSASFIYGGMLY